MPSLKKKPTAPVPPSKTQAVSIRVEICDGESFENIQNILEDKIRTNYQIDYKLTPKQIVMTFEDYYDQPCDYCESRDIYAGVYLDIKLPASVYDVQYQLYKRKLEAYNKALEAYNNQALARLNRDIKKTKTELAKLEKQKLKLK